MTSSVPTEKKENPIISTGKNIITGGVLFIGGTWTAISEDVTYGVYKPIEINKPSYQLGRVVGHTVSTVGGTLGAIGGKGLEERGIIAVPATAGLSLGITGAGYIVSGYSGGVAAKGSLGIFESAGKFKDSLKNFDSSSNNKSSGSEDINKHPNGKYEEHSKHNPKTKWKGASENPVPKEKGQELLDKAYSLTKNKQLYNYYDGKIIKFQPSGDGTWNSYQVTDTSTEVPSDVYKKMLDDKLITRPEYNKFIKNK